MLLCEHCGKSFKRNNLLNRHLRTVHLNLQRVVCDVCGKSLYKNNLQRHKLTHTKQPLQITKQVKLESPQLCEICGTVFPSGVLLKKHKRTHASVQHPETGKNIFFLFIFV